MKCVQIQRLCLKAKSSSANGTTRPDFLPEEKPRNKFWGGNLLAIRLFSAMDESRHPPSSPTATSLPGVEFMPAYRVGCRPRLGLPLGLENPVPLQLKRRPPGMAILTTPFTGGGIAGPQRKYWSLMLCQGYPIWLSHTSFHHFSHTETGLSGVASVLGCCTPSFSLCKDFSTIQRMFRLIVILDIQTYW